MVLTTTGCSPRMDLDWASRLPVTSTDIAPNHSESSTSIPIPVASSTLESTRRPNGIFEDAIDSFSLPHARSASYSPNGTTLAIASDNSIFLYSANSLSLVLEIPAKSQIWAVAWNTDGTQIASVGESGVVQIWNSASGQEISSLDLDSEWVQSVAWSPDNRTLVVGDNRGFLRLYDALTWTLIQSIKSYTGWVNITDAAWSPKGNWLVSVGGTVRVWDTQTWELSTELTVLEPHEWQTSVAWSPGGSLFAVSSSDGSISVWDADTREQVFFRENGVEIDALDWSPNGEWLISGDLSGRLQVWDVTDWSAVASTNGHGEGITSLAWSPDTTRVVSTDGSGQILIWKLAEMS